MKIVPEGLYETNRIDTKTGRFLARKGECGPWS